MQDGIDLRAYDNVLFDPIELRFAAGTLAADATDEQRAKVTNGFTTIPKDWLAPYFPVADAPAPATLGALRADGDPSVGRRRRRRDRRGRRADARGRCATRAETGEVFVTFVSRIEGSTRGTVAKEEWRPVEGAFARADRLLDFPELHARATRVAAPTSTCHVTGARAPRPGAVGRPGGPVPRDPSVVASPGPRAVG